MKLMITQVKHTKIRNSKSTKAIPKTDTKERIAMNLISCHNKENNDLGEERLETRGKPWPPVHLT